jgi:hypothetical protein
MQEFKYHLEKYHGRGSKHTCPKCGRNNCFVYYVDSDNQIINETVGKCDHINHCGYHLKPHEYFANNNNLSVYSGFKRPKITSKNYFTESKSYSAETKNQYDLGFRSYDLGFNSTFHNPNSTIITPHSTISTNYLYLTANREHNLKTFLLNYFPQEEVESVFAKYYVTGTKDGKTIFWQVDISGNIRTGKIIPYNQETGHRIKDNADIQPVSWVHNLLIKSGKIDKDFVLGQCLFGEQLLNNKSSIVIVESEKTAVIMSLNDKNNIYLAIGGEGNLTVNMFKIMRELGLNKAVLLPDKGCYDLWSEKTEEINKNLSINLICSKLVENTSILKDGEDIADLWFKMNVNL